MNPAAVNGSHAARTGSTDLGLMQINSSHLPRLAKWGITREALMTDACLNVMVGAWLLVQHMDRNGQDWNGIGSYNAACSQLKGQACTTARNTYAWKVYRALKRTPSQDEPGQKLPARLANNKPRPSIGSVDLAIGEQVAQLDDMDTETR
jgi:soluble lytic murein transglycosylase-like protein